MACEWCVCVPEEPVRETPACDQQVTICEAGPEIGYGVCFGSYEGRLDERQNHADPTPRARRWRMVLPMLAFAIVLAAHVQQARAPQAADI